MMKMTVLTAEQHDLAVQLTDIMRNHTIADAFSAMISIVAATCNGGFDMDAESRSQAVSFCDRLMATVEAGQRGELRRSSEVLQ